MSICGAKFLSKGPLQVVKYDETYKEILTSICSKYDHRVYTTFEYKDRTKYSNLLKKPQAPMTKKVVQVSPVGENSTMARKEVLVLDKGSMCSYFLPENRVVKFTLLYSGKCIYYCQG